MKAFSGLTNLPRPRLIPAKRPIHKVAALNRNWTASPVSSSLFITTFGETVPSKANIVAVPSRSRTFASSCQLSTSVDPSMPPINKNDFLSDVWKDGIFGTISYHFIFLFMISHISQQIKYCSVLAAMVQSAATKSAPLSILAETPAS